MVLKIKKKVLVFLFSVKSIVAESSNKGETLHKKM